MPNTTMASTCVLIPPVRLSSHGESAWFLMRFKLHLCTTHRSCVLSARKPFHYFQSNSLNPRHQLKHPYNRFSYGVTCPTTVHHCVGRIQLGRGWDEGLDDVPESYATVTSPSLCHTKRPVIISIAARNLYF